MSSSESNKSFKLLVEGNDEFHLISSICNRMSIQENFQIIDCKGFNNVKKNIPLIYKGSGVKRIGIVIDANSNFTERIQFVKTILKNLEFNTDTSETKHGFIFKHTFDEEKRAGFWIMPDNKQDGKLEDFIRFLVPDDDQLMPYVDKALSEIEIKGLNKYKPKDKIEAQIHTWLAWQEKPGLPFGLAIASKFLSTESPLCNQFVSWIKNLFEVS
ncbi:MAG: hypothetical protein N2747_09440 [Chitinophagaceae bacterium]|nr:hypothetical protein [Chitinophagaceae bacterium]